MEFWITFYYGLGKKQVSYKVEKIDPLQDWERFKIWGNNASIIVSNNRFLLAKTTLKARKPEWIFDGKGLKCKSLEHLICKAMERKIIEVTGKFRVP